MLLPDAAHNSRPPNAGFDTGGCALREVLSVGPCEEAAPQPFASSVRPVVQAAQVQASSAAQFLATQELRRQSGKPTDAAPAPVSFRSHDGRVGSRDEHTHLLHWFPAKMFYRIPIDILDTVAPPPGAQVLDPFCGSGTVLVEAGARGHQTIGLDINPLSCLISQAKTTPLDGPTLHDELHAIVRTAKRMRRRPDDHVLPMYWFRPAPRTALYRIYSAIQSTRLAASHRRFFTASLTNIVRRCSLADPHIPPPVRLSSDRLQRGGNRYQRAYDHSLTLDAEGVFEIYVSRTIKNIVRVASSLALDFPKSVVRCRSAAKTGLPDGSIHTIITSPPYCGAQKYVRTFKLELSLLGYTPTQIAAIDRRTLGTERVRSGARFSTRHLSQRQAHLLESIATVSKQRSKMLTAYLFGLSNVAKEIKRLLATDGSAFVTFGTSAFVKTHAVDFADIFSSFAAASGLEEFARLTDPIPSRGMMTKRHRAASVIPTETVLWLRHS